MPGPEYEIDVTYFRSTCGGGGACITEALFAGDSGQIYVPLLTNVGGRAHLVAEDTHRVPSSDGGRLHSIG